MRKAIFFLASVAVIVLVAYQTLHTDRVSGTKNQEKQPVRTIPIIATSFQETVTFSGFIRGVNQVEITSKATGSIIKLTKEEGDVVRQGEILAVLDGRELDATQKSALVTLESFNKTLKATEKYYNQKIEEAEVSRDNADASSVDALEEAFKSVKRLRDAEIASLKAQQASMAGSLLIARANASYTTIRAPFNGVITRKNSTIGTLVYPGVSVYSLSSLDALEVLVDLPSDSVSRITKGSKVSVSNASQATEGYIFSLVPGVDESSQQSRVRVRFSVPSTAQSFYFGEHVHVSFALGIPKVALLIPEQAILSQYDNTYVYVVENAVIKKQSVLLGGTTEQKREVLSGLSEGMHLVVEGMHMVGDNQLVQAFFVAHDCFSIASNSRAKVAQKAA